MGALAGCPLTKRCFAYFVRSPQWASFIAVDLDRLTVSVVVDPDQALPRRLTGHRGGAASDLSACAAPIGASRQGRSRGAAVTGQPNVANGMLPK